MRPKVAFLAGHVGGSATTNEVTEGVLRHLQWSRWSDESEEEPAHAEWGV